MKSIPRMDQARQAKLDPVDGQPPDLSQLDSGCSFRARCRFASAKCAEELPQLEQVSDTQYAACWEKDNLEEKAS